MTPLLAFVLLLFLDGSLALQFQLSQNFANIWQLGVCNDSSTTASDLLDSAAQRLNVKREYIVLYRQSGVVDAQNRITERNENLRIGTTDNACNAAEINEQLISAFGASCADTVDVLLRPMKGDHIHIAFSIFIDGLLVNLPFDRPYVCFARFTEGLGATLDTFLEQVGIWVGERTSLRYPWHTMMGNAPTVGEITMDFPAFVDGQQYNVGGTYTGDGRQNIGGTWIANWDNVPRHPRDYQTVEENRVLIKDTDTKKWRLYIWDYVNDVGVTQPRVVEDGIGRQWLNHNLAVFVLSYEDINNSVAPLPPPEQLRYLDNGYGEYEFDYSQYYTLGFDGEYYPMPNAPGRPDYPPSNPYWDCAKRVVANATIAIH